MKPALIVVCAGRWQLSGIQAAKRLGLDVIAVDGNPDAVGFAEADHVIVADINDPRAVISALGEIEILPRVIAGAVSFVAEAGQRTAATIREHFRLPGPGPELARRMTDKGLQRAAWDKVSLPSPAWVVVQDADATKAAVDRLGMPLIFKPTDSAGSRGVTVVGDGEDDDWHKAFNAAQAGSQSRQVIIERFISGTEYTVETISDRGKTHVLAVTEKVKVPGSRGTVASELATPGLPEDEVASIGNLATLAIRALGYDSGPGHTEILRDVHGDLWLVETAGRGGGFMVADGIVPKAAGYDLALATVLAAVGYPVPPIEVTEKNAVVLRFVPSRPGRLIAINGISRANAVDGVLCGALAESGQMVGAAKTDGDRLAYILTWAKTREAAFNAADRAEAEISVQIDDRVTA